MSKNKAWIQYTKTGKIIPGSLIVSAKRPKNGVWYEVIQNICCDTEPAFGVILTKPKAFIKYDNNGNIVPGSLVITDNLPKPGIWKEVYIDVCCITTTTTSTSTTTTTTTATPTTTTTTTTLPPTTTTTTIGDPLAASNRNRIRYTLVTLADTVVEGAVIDYNTFYSDSADMWDAFSISGFGTKVSGSVIAIERKHSLVDGDTLIITNETGGANAAYNLKIYLNGINNADTNNIVWYPYNVTVHDNSLGTDFTYLATTSHQVLTIPWVIDGTSASRVDRFTVTITP